MFGFLEHQPMKSYVFVAVVAGTMMDLHLEVHPTGKTAHWRNTQICLILSNEDVEMLQAPSDHIRQCLVNFNDDPLMWPVTHLRSVQYIAAYCMNTSEVLTILKVPSLHWMIRNQLAILSGSGWPKPTEEVVGLAVWSHIFHPCLVSKDQINLKTNQWTLMSISPFGHSSNYSL